MESPNGQPVTSLFKRDLKGLATPEESNSKMTEEPIRPTPISRQKAPREAHYRKIVHQDQVTLAQNPPKCHEGKASLPITSPSHSGSLQHRLKSLRGPSGVEVTR